MNALLLSASLMAGLLLGSFYFGGLWFTVRRLPRDATAGIWLLASFVVRTAVVLIGFMLVSNGRWDRIIACLIGFLIARTVLIRFCGETKTIAAGAAAVHSSETQVNSATAGGSSSQRGEY